MHLDDVARFRARLLTVGALAAPALFTLGQALLPALPDDPSAAFPLLVESRDRLLVAQLTTALGSVLFLLVVVAVWRLGGTTSRWTSFGGGLLVLIGSVSNAAGQVVSGYSAYAVTAPGVDPAAGTAVLDAFSTLGPLALPIAFPAVVVLALGLVVVALSLLPDRRVPRWIPIVVVVSTAAFSAVGGGALAVVAGVPLTIALGLLVLRVPTLDSAVPVAGSSAA
jgi:hypothetical protein